MRKYIIQRSMSTQKMQQKQLTASEDTSRLLEKVCKHFVGSTRESGMLGWASDTLL